MPAKMTIEESNSYICPMDTDSNNEYSLVNTYREELLNLYVNLKNHSRGSDFLIIYIYSISIENFTSIS